MYASRRFQAKFTTLPRDPGLAWIGGNRLRLAGRYATVNCWSSGCLPLNSPITRASLTEAQLLAQIDLERLPRHIAVIMDGYGRWAKRRHLPRIAGHRSGVAAVRSTVETAARAGIRALTLYSFSVENWKRPKSEVQYLMNLLRRYLMMELPTLMENNIRL